MKKITLLLFLCSLTVFAKMNYHVLMGAEGGYLFSYFQINSLDNMIDNFNQNEARLNGSDVTKMDKFSTANGFYIRYNLYKYLDKSGKHLKSYEVSGTYEKNYSSVQSTFSYQLNDEKRVNRIYDFSYSDLSVNFNYGFSPIRSIIISLQSSIGYSHFSLNSSLDYSFYISPEQQSVANYEEERFNAQTDSTGLYPIQNGIFTGNGISIMGGVKGEYFFSDNLSTSFSIFYKYINISKLKNEKYISFKKAQDIDKSLTIEGINISLKLGISYYILLE